MARPATEPIALLQWSHTISGMETIRRCFVTVDMSGLLQWSHTISGMETRRRRLRGPDNSSGFNGAIPFQVWKLYRQKGDEKDETNASMEPYHFRYGNCNSPYTKMNMVMCFNGAIPFQVWKRQRNSKSPHNPCKLQWSHTISGMETG